MDNFSTRKTEHFTFREMSDMITGIVTVMNEIEIFKNEAFGEVRVAGTSEEPLFCLADVCKILNLQTGVTKNRLDEKGISLINTPTNGGIQQLIYVNESNLYKVIMRSDKPQAEPFQDWVCSEVLPSIRKTGGYSVEKKLPKNYLEALRELVVAVEENERLSLENSSMQPKARYFDALVARNMLTNIRDTAKQLHLSQREFVSLLLENRFVYRDEKNSLKPFVEYVPSCFEIKDFEKNGYTGTQLLVTPKGKETFRLLWGR